MLLVKSNEKTEEGEERARDRETGRQSMAACKSLEHFSRLSPQRVFKHELSTLEKSSFNCLKSP